MREQSTQANAGGLTPDNGELDGGTPPATKTPFFKANHSKRYQRQTLIKGIQERTKRILICYVSGSECAIDRDDTVPFVDLLHNVPQGRPVDLLLHTGGGDTDVAEKLMEMLRGHVGAAELRVIVPDFAKSAGTLMILGADRVVSIRLPGAGLIFSRGNGRKWTEPPGKLLHDEVVPAQICRHRGVGLCGCEGVGNEGHEGRLAGRRTCAEHVAVESAHGRLAVPLSPRQLVGASSAATVGPGGSLAGRWVWRLPRRIPVPHGGARPRGSRRWRRRHEDTRRGPTPRTAASCLVAFPPLAAKPTGRGLGRRRDGAD